MAAAADDNGLPPAASLEDTTRKLIELKTADLKRLIELQDDPSQAYSSSWLANQLALTKNALDLQKAKLAALIGQKTVHNQYQRERSSYMRYTAKVAKGTADSTTWPKSVYKASCREFCRTISAYAAELRRLSAEETQPQANASNDLRLNCVLPSVPITSITVSVSSPDAPRLSAHDVDLLKYLGGNHPANPQPSPHPTSCYVDNSTEPMILFDYTSLEAGRIAWVTDRAGRKKITQEREDVLNGPGKDLDLWMFGCFQNRNYEPVSNLAAHLQQCNIYTNPQSTLNYEKTIIATETDIDLTQRYIGRHYGQKVSATHYMQLQTLAEAIWDQRMRLHFYELDEAEYLRGRRWCFERRLYKQHFEKAARRYWRPPDDDTEV
jgi:hypothetical protein